MGRVLACSCCGHWRVEQIVLDGRQALRVVHHGFLVGYAWSTAEVVRLLQRDGGPALAAFEPCQGLGTSACGCTAGRAGDVRRRT